ncbi:hypothetical protein X777_12914 [Ooceraea biroi]|uniref:Uncharacterized protein n=1 Tax=Ooceraea biroi TaxID=2015173 RepID=A0A026VYM6_OOCBI|nr:hypothetical protein X777_12914 [Ooceraea biroi]
MISKDNDNSPFKDCVLCAQINRSKDKTAKHPICDLRLKLYPSKIHSVESAL